MFYRRRLDNVVWYRFNAVKWIGIYVKSHDIACFVALNVYKIQNIQIFNFTQGLWSHHTGVWTHGFSLSLIMIKKISIKDWHINETLKNRCGHGGISYQIHWCYPNSSVVRNQLNTILQLLQNIDSRLSDKPCFLS